MRPGKKDQANMHLRAYRQLNAIAVFCSLMANENTKVLDAAAKTATIFYTTAKTGDGSRHVSERTVREWYALWLTERAEGREGLPDDTRGHYYRPDVLDDHSEFKLAAVAWLAENTKPIKMKGRMKKRRRRFVRLHLSTRMFRDFCNKYFEDNNIKTDFYKPHEHRGESCSAVAPARKKYKSHRRITLKEDGSMEYSTQIVVDNN